MVPDPPLSYLNLPPVPLTVRPHSTFKGGCYLCPQKLQVGVLGVKFDSAARTSWSHLKKCHGYAGNPQELRCSGDRFVERLLVLLGKWEEAAKKKPKKAYKLFMARRAKTEVPLPPPGLLDPQNIGEAERNREQLEEQERQAEEMEGVEESPCRYCRHQGNCPCCQREWPCFVCHPHDHPG